MNIRNQTIILFLLIQSILNTSCDKDEAIDLNANYLTVTDVIKYCSRECGEYQDLKGEPIKIKGFIRVSPSGQIIKQGINSKNVFSISDIRNSKIIRVEVVNDSLAIANELHQNSKKMLLISGKLDYDFFINSNSSCDNTLFIELDSSENMSFK